MFIFIYLYIYFVLNRADHNLQDVRAKIFPYKRRRVKAPEVVASVTLPLRRKERSLSSLVVNTPRVSTQTPLTGKRSRFNSRKKYRGPSFSVEKRAKKEDDSMDDCQESSSSPETSNRIKRNSKQVKMPIILSRRGKTGGSCNRPNGFGYKIVL